MIDKIKKNFYAVGTVLLWLLIVVGTIVSTKIIQQNTENRGKAKTIDSIHDVCPKGTSLWLGECRSTLSGPTSSPAITPKTSMPIRFPTSISEEWRNDPSYSDCVKLASGSWFCGGTRGGSACEPDLKKGGDYCMENGVSVPCSTIGRIRCQCNNEVWVIGSEGQDCGGLCGATNNVCETCTSEPVQTSKPGPTNTPVIIPSATPTLKPTVTLTPKPTATPTIKPSLTPTQTPILTITTAITPTIEPTITTTPNPTAIPTSEPTATPTVKPQTCGYSPCNNANIVCSGGLVCIQSSNGNNYCSKPEFVNNCTINPGYAGCCLGVTNTSAPTKVIAEGPTPTVIVLPVVGFEFPGIATIILGTITALVGLIIIL